MVQEDVEHGTTILHTAMVADIHPTGDSKPQSLFVFQSKLLFVANDGMHGAEVWACDATTEEVTMLIDSQAGPGDGIYLGFLAKFTVLPNSPYVLFESYAVNNRTWSQTLYATNGTPQGPTRLAPLTFRYTSRIDMIVPFQGKVYLQNVFSDLLTITCDPLVDDSCVPPTASPTMSPSVLPTEPTTETQPPSTAPSAAPIELDTQSPSTPPSVASMERNPTMMRPSVSPSIAPAVELNSPTGYSKSD